MEVGTFCALSPFLSRKKVSGFDQKKLLPEANKRFDVSNNHREMKRSTVRNTCGIAGNFITMTELRNKILTFRDLLDLTPCVGSDSTDELLIWTLKDLYKSYPNIKPILSVSDLEGASRLQVLENFCAALRSLGDLWTSSDEWMDKCKQKEFNKLDLNDLEQLVLATLEDINKLARERLFDVMDEDDQMRDCSPLANPFGKALTESDADNKSSFSCSPATPTSILPEISHVTSDGTKISYSPPLLLPLRVQAVGKLNPIDLKRLSFHMLPHVAAQNPNFRVQISRTVMEQPKIETKYNFEVKPGVKDEASQESRMQEDAPMIQLRPNSEEITEIDGRNCFNSLIKQVSATDEAVISTPQTIPRLRSDLAELMAPAQPSTFSLLTNEAEMQEPAPPQMHSPLVSPGNNLEAMQVSPRAAPSLPPSQTLSSPSFSQNFAVASARPPPLAPPPLAPSTLSSITTESITMSPPAPPPPPPVACSNIGPVPSPPPTPPITSRSRNAAPPPPLPPQPMGSSNVAPLPLSPLPMGSSNVVPPPPSPSTGGKSTAPPPPPPPMGGTRGIAPPPPPPPMGRSNGAVPAPPPPLPMGKNGAPPPPPGLAGARNLRPKKATTKLRRSSQMGNLYRLLKGKVEGSSLNGKSKGKGSKIGAASGGKQGMADALAEMTKRSTYFQQIEEDVKNHAKTIKEVKVAISNFQTSDMAELIKFHKYVESHLEKLTDESQVLARFEDFPTKKLEALRMAAALYSKFDKIATTLQNWQIVPPANQLLDKVESYFNKIKGDMETMERTKDEEAKKFQSHKINFDFGILVRIKELMVDASSGCMELALKERREAKAKVNAENGSKTDGKKMASGKMLWKSFQLAYRVYTFAGGHDDRADKLTRELAKEIETDP